MFMMVHLALLCTSHLSTVWNFMELLTFPMFLAEGCWRWVTIFPGWSMTSHGPMTQMRQDCLYLRSLHGCGGAAPLSCGCVLPAACRLIDSEGPYEHVPPMGPRSCTIRVNYSDLTATSLELWIRIRIEVTIPKWPYFELMNYHFIRFYCRHYLSSIKIYHAYHGTWGPGIWGIWGIVSRTLHCCWLPNLDTRGSLKLCYGGMPRLSFSFRRSSLFAHVCMKCIEILANDGR